MIILILSLGLILLWAIGAFIKGVIMLEDDAWQWPLDLLAMILWVTPGVRQYMKRQRAYLAGREDMRYGTLKDPMSGRRNGYMSHKNKGIYEAYIKGGNDVLAEYAEEAAGISLGQLRRESLKQLDEQRLKQVEIMKQTRKEMLAPPEDKWQTEFERITK